MKADTAEKKRLARIEGQIRGIDRMLDEDRRCEEVLMEIQAARSALRALAQTLVQRELKDILRSVTAAPATAEKKVGEAMRLLKYAS